MTWRCTARSLTRIWNRLVWLAVAMAPLHAVAEIRYATAPVDGTTIVDARSQADCLQGSLPGARCLPSSSLVGGDGQLIGAKALLWRLGTLGLSGAEQVLVVGEDATDRDMVGAVLYLAGMPKVSVLLRPVSRLVAEAPGQVPGAVRSAVFSAPMRDKQLVFARDVREALRAEEAAPVVVDGRPEQAYWAGHLPGGQPLPLDTLRRSLGQAVPAVLPPREPIIAYGAGPRDGLALFTLLAATGSDVRVYAGGWRDWTRSGRH